MWERLASVRSSSGTSSSLHGRSASLLPWRTNPPARYPPPAVGGDPADRYLVVSGKDLVADLHRCNSEALAWTQSVGPHLIDGGGGVDEDRVSMDDLLAPVQDPERLLDSERLGIEYHFVCPEVKAASGPAIG